MDELRRIRRRISQRLLEADRREGTFIPEIRRMAREATRRWRRECSEMAARNGRKHAR